MVWRGLLLAACVALGAGSAEAQGVRVFGPEGVPLTIATPEPGASEASVAAQLSDALANYDNSGITVRDGVVQRGEEFATRAMPYDSVRRLTNDVTRSGALGGRVVVLQAGTPLYYQDYINPDMLFVHGTTRLRALWCGANGESGHCLLFRGGDWETAEIRSDTPYNPSNIGRWVPASDAGLASDPAALAELPERTEVFRFERMRGGRAVIARALRVGGDSYDMDDIQVRQMRLGSIIVRVEPGPDAGSARVSSAALDPAEHQFDLRRLASGLLSRGANR